MFNYIKLPSDNCEFITIGKQSDLEDGKRYFVEIDGTQIVVFKIAGEFFAIGDICSHDDGPLGDGELAGFEIICPRHGARFDIRSGKALSLPAVVDIPAYPVRIESGEVKIGIPLSSN
jgi:3-phenylpropionate/trans-cinnamate dioxygenase ferredoxin subunit